MGAIQQLLAARGGIPLLIDRTAGTVIGAAAGYGALAKLFDGNTNQSRSAGCGWIAATGWAGKSWGGGNAKIVSQAVVTATNDLGWTGGTPGTPTLYLEGSDTGAWGGEQVVLGSSTSADNPSEVCTIIATTFAAYLFHRVRLVCANGDVGMAEIAFYVEI
jgi:hypothetical protein